MNPIALVSQMFLALYFDSVSVFWFSVCIRGKLSFTRAVSVTLNFHPQGRNVDDVTNELKSWRLGGHCD